jgi:hypothetical protein
VVGGELIRGGQVFGKGNCVRDVISTERHGALKWYGNVDSCGAVVTHDKLPFPVADGGV